MADPIAVPPRPRVSAGSSSTFAGGLMALGSAACFGTLAILAKLAYASGMTVAQLLSLRFALATLATAGLCAATRSNPFAIAPRRLITLAVLGVCFYGLQSFLFFTSLVSLPASLVELLLYLYPAIVVLIGWTILKRSVSRRLLVALVGSLLGVALLSGGVRGGGGTALIFALLTPFGYAAYLVAAEWAMRGQSTLAASVVVFAGASCFWAVLAVLRGQLALPPSGHAVLILGLLVLGPSLLGISLVLAALRRIGSERVSLLSTLEPVVTVALAFTLLGERLLPVQLVGAVVVLLAIVLIQWPAAVVDRPTHPC